MRGEKRSVFAPPAAVAAICAAFALAPTSAGAAETTIGADVNQSFSYTGACSGGGMASQRPCTVINLQTNPVRTMRSTCDGAVVRFRLNGILSGNTYRIRAVTDNGNGTFTPTATSAPPVTIQSPGVNEYPANMPIKQGQYVGIDFMDSDESGLRGISLPQPGFLEHYFYTFPADGTPDTPTGQDPAIYLYNADVRCSEPGKSAAKKCKKKKKKKQGKSGAAAAKKKKKKGCKKKKKKKK